MLAFRQFVINNDDGDDNIKKIIIRINITPYITCTQYYFNEQYST